jgi:hypothetical protein
MRLPIKAPSLPLLPHDIASAGACAAPAGSKQTQQPEEGNPKMSSNDKLRSMIWVTKASGPMRNARFTIATFDNEMFARISKMLEAIGFKTHRIRRITKPEELAQMALTGHVPLNIAVGEGTLVEVNKITGVSAAPHRRFGVIKVCYRGRGKGALRFSNGWIVRNNPM